MIITLATIVKKNEDVIAGSIDREIVAMNIQTGKCFQLNETGGRTLALLDQPRSVGDLCEEMAAGYDIDREICRRDVIEFIQAVEEFGLIKVE